MVASSEDDKDEDGGGLISLDMAQFGSGSMNDPLRHAMGMRSAQDQCTMRMWNSFPQLFQNTIFHGEQDAEIKELRRTGSLAARLSHARHLKDAGNAALKAASASAPEAASPAPAPSALETSLRLRIDEAEALVVQKERELRAAREELSGLRKELESELLRANGSATSSTAKPAASAVGARPSDGLRDAITSYEKAAGLLRYVECTRPDWKNDDGSYKGIEDDNLRVDTAALDGDNPEAEEARELVTSCYLNIALASQKLEDFDQMTKACDEVLKHINPKSVKALYRRAQAAVAPVKALDEDRARAIQDLHAAAQLEPNNKDVRSLLARLRAERRAQGAADRSTFAGLFERGEVVTGGGEEARKLPAEPQPNWDLRDPKVQAMLDIRPGPGQFDS